jgi:uncharacterized protein YifE (UPF0438 family)
MAYSDAELLLITKYLKFYRSLDLGQRIASTPEQKRFVEVCRGKVEAITDHETAYKKYQQYQLESHNLREAIPRKTTQENHRKKREKGAPHKKARYKNLPGKKHIPRMFRKSFIREEGS